MTNELHFAQSCLTVYESGVMVSALIEQRGGIPQNYMKRFLPMLSGILTCSVWVLIINEFQDYEKQKHCQFFAERRSESFSYLFFQ